MHEILGIIFSNDISWNRHIEYIIKKVCKRIFIIRNLRRANCPTRLMIRCYIAFIRSLLTYCFACFCNLPNYLFEKMSRIESRVFKIIGVSPDQSASFSTACVRSCTKLYSEIVKFEDHPLRELFESKQRRVTRHTGSLYRPFAKTKRFGDSFIKFCK